MILQNNCEFSKEYDLPSGFVEHAVKQQTKALVEAMLNEIEPWNTYCIRYRIDRYEDMGKYVQGYKAAMEIDKIVRCKECRWRKEYRYPKGVQYYCDLNCRVEDLDGTESDLWFYVRDDDFCSRGERIV